MPIGDPHDRRLCGSSRNGVRQARSQLFLPKDKPQSTDADKRTSPDPLRQKTDTPPHDDTGLQ
jgi:hypothetical protein